MQKEFGGIRMPCASQQTGSCVKVLWCSHMCDSTVRRQRNRVLEWRSLVLVAKPRHDLEKGARGRWHFVFSGALNVRGLTTCLSW